MRREGNSVAWHTRNGDWYQHLAVNAHDSLECNDGSISCRCFWFEHELSGHQFHGCSKSYRLRLFSGHWNFLGVNIEPAGSAGGTPFARLLAWERSTHLLAYLRHTYRALRTVNVVASKNIWALAQRYCSRSLIARITTRVPRDYWNKVKSNIDPNSKFDLNDWIEVRFLTALVRTFY